MSPTSYQAAPPRNRTTSIGRPGPWCQAALTGRTEAWPGPPGAPLRPPGAASRAGSGPRGILVLHEAGALAMLRASDREKRLVSLGTDPFVRRFALNRLWSRALPGLLALSMLLLGAGLARAAAEVHRFSLVLSAMPTQIVGGDFNDAIDVVNRTGLIPRGLESLDKISYGWLFDGELRYFVRQNFAISGGVGQLRSKSKREYSFTTVDNVTVTAEVLSVPLHVGGDYYFTPYNQGDFQARAYVGGGLLSLTDTKASIITVAATTVGAGTFGSLSAGDATGWYAEVGAHMFFAARYSVMLGGIYRSAVVATPGVYVNDRLVATNVPRSIDLGGAGARLSLAIGF